MLAELVTEKFGLLSSEILGSSEEKLSPFILFLLLLLSRSVMSDSVRPHNKDGSPPGSPIPGILQAGTLEWVAISSSNA